MDSSMPAPSTGWRATTGASGAFCRCLPVIAVSRSGPCSPRATGRCGSAPMPLEPGAGMEAGRKLRRCLPRPARSMRSGRRPTVESGSARMRVCSAAPQPPANGSRPAAAPAYAVCGSKPAAGVRRCGSGPTRRERSSFSSRPRPRRDAAACASGAKRACRTASRSAWRASATICGSAADAAWHALTASACMRTPRATGFPPRWCLRCCRCAMQAAKTSCWRRCAPVAWPNCGVTAAGA